MSLLRPLSHLGRVLVRGPTRKTLTAAKVPSPILSQITMVTRSISTSGSLHTDKADLPRLVDMRQGPKVGAYRTDASTLHIWRSRCHAFDASAIWPRVKHVHRAYTTSKQKYPMLNINGCLMGRNWSVWITNFLILSSQVPGVKYWAMCMVNPVQCSPKLVSSIPNWN